MVTDIASNIPKALYPSSFLRLGIFPDYYYFLWIHVHAFAHQIQEQLGYQFC